MNTEIYVYLFNNDKPVLEMKERAKYTRMHTCMSTACLSAAQRSFVVFNNYLKYDYFSLKIELYIEASSIFVLVSFTINLY